jgi:hypothetical protein
MAASDYTGAVGCCSSEFQEMKRAGTFLPPLIFLYPLLEARHLRRTFKSNCTYRACQKVTMNAQVEAKAHSEKT